MAEEPEAPQTVIFEEDGKEYSVEVKPEVHDLKELSGALSRNELKKMNALIEQLEELFDVISLDMKCTTTWSSLLTGLRELRVKRFEDLIDWNRIAEGK